MKKGTSVKNTSNTDVTKAKSNLTRDELEKIYQVKIGFGDPNKVDLEQMYQDNVPQEAIVLDEFLRN